jgi:hypothetical protein
MFRKLITTAAGYLPKRAYGRWTRRGAMHPLLTTVAEYLAGHYGVDARTDRGFVSKVGKEAARIYRTSYGRNPLQFPSTSPEGLVIVVNGYQTPDEWMITEAYITVGIREFESVAA